MGFRTANAGAEKGKSGSSIQEDSQEDIAGQ